ncbi:MAG: protein kinase [Polyangiaceae bacterium]|nr:protein kinase [Polyangiaceae bacterium]MCW5789906.1 protein kinase [Polyangiaceae bacterium]
MQLQAGSQLAQYTLLEPLGRGGQATVWRVRDPQQPGAELAVKLVPLVGRTHTQIERVRREADQLRQLSHPSIVQVHGTPIEDPQRQWLGVVMSYVDGKSLETAIRQGGLSARHRWLVLRHLTAALAHVHERGLIHRDVKPDNVMLVRDFWEHPEDARQLKLVDFGISVSTTGQQPPLTQAGYVSGTPPYMAPERLNPHHFREPAGPRQDLFALGVLAWQLFEQGPHPTGLRSNAGLLDFERVYREASRMTWPPATGNVELDELLRATLPIHASERARDAGALLTLVDALVQRVGVVTAPLDPYDGLPTEISLPPTTEDIPLQASPPQYHAPRAAPRATPHVATQDPATWSVPTTNTGVAVPTLPTQLPTAHAAPPTAGPWVGPQHPAIPLTQSAAAHTAPSAPHGARRMNWGAIGGITFGLGALLLLGAVLLGGGTWVLTNQPAGASIPPLASTGAPSPALGGDPPPQQPAPQAAPAPQATPAPQTKPEPDSVPSGCDPEAPCVWATPKRTCCPSGFDCGGPCGGAIPASERFLLRYGGGGDGKVTLERSVVGGRVCTSIPGSKGRMCFPVTEGDITLKTRHPITGGDLARGIDVQVYDARGRLIASVNYRQPFTRGVTCKGILVKGFTGDPRVKLVSLFVDPEGQAPRRCEGRQLSFGQD